MATQSTIAAEKIRLFLSVMDDLGRCTQSQGEYEILRIAGLLRLLILDSPSLTDQVNRELRHKYRFEVGRYYGTETALRFPPVMQGLALAAVEDGFAPGHYPVLSPNDVPEIVKRDRLLALIVMLVQGHPITVRALISHMAYVAGVVHAGEAEGSADEALLGVRQLVQVGGHPAGLRTLRAVGRVVQAGLVPLKDAVVAKYAS